MPVMTPPSSGAKIRMYRQGHGDCFLIAFRQSDGSPFYLLIDCGLKKGSEVRRKRNNRTVFHSIQDIVDDINESTNGHLNLVVVTHEHEDHVSGFLRCKSTFEQMQIDELWLAWTEDPNHELANDLRRKYKDTLIGLLAIGQHLHGAVSPEDLELKNTINDLLQFETEDGELPFGTNGRRRIPGITNKKAIKLLRERAELNRGTRYLAPHQAPLQLPDVPDVRFFILGPPESEAKLKDLDPKGDEEFHLAAARGKERSLFAAARNHAASFGTKEPFGAEMRLYNENEIEGNEPFAKSYRISPKLAKSPKFRKDFANYLSDPQNEWRQIDTDWLRTGEQFALRMNSYVNNTSLVFAIELANTGKVLLFVGDAQRGNWISWRDKKWTSANGLKDGETIDTDDLLARTVFYKVGHHGSHNATLNEGGLKCMALGEFSKDFVAMIPTQEHWAKHVKSKPWQHPLDEIYTALRRKSRGRLFQIDGGNIRKPRRETRLISTRDWNRFKRNVKQSTMFFEYTVEDK